MRLSAFRLLAVSMILGAFGGYSVSPSPALAGDDGQGSLVGAFIGKLTGTDDMLDNAPPVVYHERGPLVMPKDGKSADLPPPSAEPSKRTQAWPNDPDVARRREAKLKANSPEIQHDNSEKLSNEELAHGKRTSSASTEPVIECDSASRGCGDPRAIWDPLKQKKASEDTSVLQAGVEPQRQYLTQPPKGFLVPQKVVKYTFDAPGDTFVDGNGEQANDYYRQQSQRNK